MGVICRFFLDRKPGPKTLEQYRKRYPKCTVTFYQGRGGWVVEILKKDPVVETLDVFWGLR